MLNTERFNLKVNFDNKDDSFNIVSSTYKLKLLETKIKEAKNYESGRLKETATESGTQHSTKRIGDDEAETREGGKGK